MIFSRISFNNESELNLGWAYYVDRQIIFTEVHLKWRDIEEKISLKDHFFKSNS